MARRIDADGHVLEPPDVWARYLEPRWRERAIRVTRQPDGSDVLLIDGRPAALTTPAMLGGFGGMGRSIDELAAATLSGRYAENAPAAATDPGARLQLLDGDGIGRALLYPSLGLQWEAECPDAAYAAAHACAYNRWIEEFCAGKRRAAPAGSASRAGRSAGERRRAAPRRAGRRPRRVRAAVHERRAPARPCHLRPVWAAAVECDVPIAIHTGIDPPARSLHRRFDHVSWPEAVPESIWYLQMMFPQAVQQAFSTFFQWATFDRFPALRVVVLESGASWLGFWMDRMDAMAKSPLRVTMSLRHLPSDYVRRQCWISADPDERGLPAVMDYVGADRFLWATDYPHSDHGGDYVHELDALLGHLAPATAAAIAGENAARLYRL